MHVEISYSRETQRFHNEIQHGYGRETCALFDKVLTVLTGVAGPRVKVIVDGVPVVGIVPAPGAARRTFAGTWKPTLRGWYVKPGRANDTWEACGAGGRVVCTFTVFCPIWKRCAAGCCVMCWMNRSSFCRRISSCCRWCCWYKALWRCWYNRSCSCRTRCMRSCISWRCWISWRCCISCSCWICCICFNISEFIRILCATCIWVWAWLPGGGSWLRLCAGTKSKNIEKLHMNWHYIEWSNKIIVSFPPNPIFSQYCIWKQLFSLCDKSQPLPRILSETNTFGTREKVCALKKNPFSREVSGGKINQGLI